MDDAKDPCRNSSRLSVEITPGFISCQGSRQSARRTGFASMELEDVKKVLSHYPSAAARITTHTGEVLSLPA